MRTLGGRTLLIIAVTRVLGHFWPEFKELMRTYPDIVYGIDGLVLAFLTWLSNQKLKKAQLEVKGVVSIEDRGSPSLTLGE